MQDVYRYHYRNRYSDLRSSYYTFRLIDTDMKSKRKEMNEYVYTVCYIVRRCYLSHTRILHLCIFLRKSV